MTATPPIHLKARFSQSDSISAFISNRYTSFLHTFYFTVIGICVARILPLQLNLAGRRNLPTFENVLTQPRTTRRTFFQFIDFRPQYLFSNFMVSNTSHRCQLGSVISSELQHNDWEITPDVSWNTTGPHSREIDLPSSRLFDSARYAARMFPFTSAPCPRLNLHFPLHKRAIYGTTLVLGV
ncbi:hypothetical protein B0H13DRAFT_1058057 [Mycena leptocephala]|nr:hypothetical protein B0H13DRAFT_1058057 [Mycena leptocephala]